MSVTASPRARRPPLSAFRTLLICEMRLAWRTPRGIAIGLGLPLLLLVVFGELPAFQRHLASYGGLTRFDIYVPILASLVIAALALIGLPGPLASYREDGVLRRLSTTPVSPAWVLAAQVAINALLAIVALLVLFVVGIVAFGLASPRDPGALLVSLGLGIAALFAIGLSIAAVARIGTLQVLSAATFFPLIFFAGLWVPRAQMPAVLQHISDDTPLGAAVQASQDSMQGAFPPARPLWVLGAYAVVFALVAWRCFEWE